MAIKLINSYEILTTNPKYCGADVMTEEPYHYDRALFNCYFVVQTTKNHQINWWQVGVIPLIKGFC